MINFRYHVVSLTAVFLALAIGLIVGTAALNGQAADALKHSVNQLSAENTQYRGQVKALESEVAAKEEFATALAPAVLQDKLAGRRVLVVSMQQSSTYVADMLNMLALSGAKVTGDVELEDHFTDPASNGDLLDLANTALNTVQISDLPANSDGVETGSAMLAAVLMDHTPVVTPDTRATVLQAFSQKHFIKINGDVTGPAEAVIVLANPPYTDQNATQENANMVTIVDQFSKAGPIVVGAAGASGTGNIIGAVTGDATLSQTVSTVDNTNTPQGRIAAVLALNEQITYKKTGHYGLASSASSLLPKLPE